MTPERWQQIEKVLQSALDCPEGQREAFLDEACAGDQDMRQEVESLLSSHGRAGRFLEAPLSQASAAGATEIAPAPPNPVTEDLTGKVISQYRVLEKLGGGGMGVVYKAQHTKLSKWVALKFLPESLSQDSQAVERFKREAQAASKLDHPNICFVYDIGEHEGRPFIAMQFLSGQTLKHWMGGKPVEVSQILELGRQIADGLQAAHAQGIIHRDIKPANIFVTQDQHLRAKILDFGLAKLLPQQALGGSTERDQTSPGHVLGTIPYMSPEQARGEPLDSRTDLFSFGAVLYEMATGRPAFDGSSAAMIHDAVLNRTPTSPKLLNPQLPAKLDEIITKALEKNRNLRYQTASDLHTDLERLRRELELRSGASSGQADLAPIPSLAVLPLTNVSGDPETDYLSDGITESIINSLSRLPRLRVLRRSATARFKGPDVDPQQAGRDLGVEAVLTGRVLQRSDQLIISAALVDVREGWQIWGERYNQPFSDIFSVEEAIARKISEKLRGQIAGDRAALGEPEELITVPRAKNTDAYQDYLKGRFYWEKWTVEGWQKGIEYFERAIQKDPTYALAYSGLADSYVYLGWFSVLPRREAYPKAKAAALKAVEMDNSLAEAHTSLAGVLASYEWNFRDAEEEFKRSIALNPYYVTAHHWYAECLKQMGRKDKAFAEIIQAQKLDPHSLIVTTSVGWHYYFTRQYDEAIEQYLLARKMDPNFGPVMWGLGWAYEQKSMFAEAIREFQQGISLSGHSPIYVAGLGHTYAASGDREKAQKVLEDLKELSSRAYVPPYFIAAIYAALGDKDRAFEWLNETYEEHSSWLLYLRGDPRLDSLRSDPRFHDLQRRVSPSKVWQARKLRVWAAGLVGLLALTAYWFLRPPVSPPPARAGKIMMAVLSFENLSGDPGQEYFSDGLTEETIAQLGSLKPDQLGVIARTTTISYKHSTKSADQICRELGVQYLLEGAVRRAENKVRINSRLIQCNNQTPVWASTFERDMRDVLAIQSDVAEAIAHATEIHLTPQTQARLASPASVNPAAYDAYLKGRSSWNNRYEAPNALEKSVEYFQQATQLDPGFALAYSGLADAYSLLGSNSIDALPPQKALKEAKAAAEKAVQLDDGLAEAHASLASVRLSYEWDLAGAEQEFKRAIELNPSYPTAHQWYGSYLIAAGQPEAALTQGERALSLDPLSPVINIDLGWKYYMARQYDRAIEQCNKTIRLYPQLYLSRYVLGMSYERKGLYRDAISEFQQGRALSNDSPIMIMALGHAYALSGNTAAAQKTLAELKGLSAKRYVPALYVASLYDALGNRTQAFQWLQQAVIERSDQMVFLKVDPMADNIRSDPRFPALIRTITP